MAGRRSATPEPLEGRVRDLGHRGEAVVETDVGVIFVPGALPGERVRVGLDDKKRGGVRRGRLLAILTPSEDRQEPPCEAQGRCGGCPLMILSAAAASSWKARAASQATGLEVELERAGEALGYRRRARLSFRDGRLGYRHPRARRIVDIPSCPILVEPLEQALGALRTRLSPHLSGAGELVLALGQGGPVAWVRVADPQPPEVYGVLRDLVDEGTLFGTSLVVADTAAAETGDPREVSVGVDGAPLIGPTFGFSQANALVNDALVRRVVAFAAPRDATVVELYAGHGNITVALAERCRALTAVEHSVEAAAACRDNLARRGLEAKVVSGDAGAFAGRKADVVVLDPPRTGAREAIERIVALDPTRIVYVSCDVATLRRDLGTLAKHGFVPRDAAAFDMFPQTAHLEVVVRLERTAQ